MDKLSLAIKKGVMGTGTFSGKTNQFLIFKRENGTAKNLKNY